MKGMFKVREALIGTKEVPARSDSFQTAVEQGSCPFCGRSIPKAAS